MDESKSDRVIYTSTKYSWYWLVYEIAVTTYSWYWLVHEIALVIFDRMPSVKYVGW